MAGAAASALLTAHSDHGSGAVREIAFDELAREGLMILVAGATGSLGGKIATGLQSSRQSVRALVRPTSNAGSLANASAEASLRQSGISYTILQPNAFMDVWFGMLIEGPVARGQPVTLVRESKRRDSFIAERDVAAFAMAATDHPAARNTTMVLGGPDRHDTDFR